MHIRNSCTYLPSRRNKNTDPLIKLLVNHFKKGRLLEILIYINSKGSKLQGSS